MAEQANTSARQSNSTLSGTGTQLAERPVEAAHAASGSAAHTASGSAAHTATGSAASSASGSATTGTRTATRGTKSYGAARAGTKPIPFAAVSFVSGLVGLLIANLILGPLAIVLGVVGLRVDKNRRVRAALGILLGVADIVVFAVLAAHSAHHGSVSWNFFSN